MCRFFAASKALKKIVQSQVVVQRKQKAEEFFIGQEKGTRASLCSEDEELSDF